MKLKKLIIKKDHALVPLTKGKFAIIDLDDVDKIKNYNWYASKARKDFYAARMDLVKNKYVYMHRIINSTEKGFFTDHINGNTLDNRKINLRTCTNQDNNCNSKKIKGTSSNYKGVTRCDKRYFKSQIQINKKNIHLGYFSDEIEAAKAYDDAALKYHGEFALTNKKIGLL